MGRGSTYANVITHNGRIKWKTFIAKHSFLSNHQPAKQCAPRKRTTRGTSITYRSASSFTTHKKLSIWYINSLLTTNSSHDACYSTYVQYHHPSKAYRNTFTPDLYTCEVVQSDCNTWGEKNTLHRVGWTSKIQWPACTPTVVHTNEISTAITYTICAKHDSMYHYAHASRATQLTCENLQEVLQWVRWQGDDVGWVFIHKNMAGCTTRQCCKWGWTYVSTMRMMQQERLAG